jgi:hypothetical protein
VGWQVEDGRDERYDCVEKVWGGRENKEKIERPE